MLRVDVLVIYDDVQFKRQSWQHRFELPKGQQKRQLITIPIKHIDFFKPINQIRIYDGNDTWKRKLLKTLQLNYQNQPWSHYWLLVKSCLENRYLFEAQMAFIEAAKKILDIETKLCLSSELDIQGDQTQRLIDICKYFNADEYICGHTAYRSYMDLDLFDREDVKVTPQNWRCKYLYGNTSILDPLFRYGEKARKWIE